MKTQTLTREEFIAQFIAKQEQERANCADMRKDPQACATVLWKLACGDTSGGRAASALLLSLWNNHFAANMRDVMGNLDIKHTEAVLGLLEHMGGGCWLERYLTQDQIVRVIDQWGEFHEVRRVRA
ncbi:hypothetical protein [Marinobacter nauticus]|uniref:DUF7673 domain-containing protein n=1 Tax=Marinobacter nauticus TaxID=2743 RepID=A0A368VBY7_MARNT|nr:hypothetical protein [Marinobacter nauticus]RBP76974.1 hypothetical protein DET64_101158 [Marinobacter nauticus]RCW37820.1 hypothetical protein DET51_101157 [Marinobacter nauticus]